MSEEQKNLTAPLKSFEDYLNKNIIFKILTDAAKDLGLKTYLIGGYVRDLLLNRASKDIDVVCVGNGIELAKDFAARLSRSLGKNLEVIEYKNFGTAMVTFQNYIIEFVGARKESYHLNSRNPSVQLGSLSDDQNRRDFTINALSISLNKEDYGQLIDPFNGLRDIEKKILKTPLDPKLTFQDDPLRMLRAIRFANQLNFTISPKTLQAIIKNKKRIKIISQERIRDEFNKILMTPKPSLGFKLLYESGLLTFIFPELLALKGVEIIDNKRHKDNFYHTLEVLDNISKTTKDLYLRWAALLHDIAKPATKRFNNTLGWTFHGHEDLGSKMVPKIFRHFCLPMNYNMRFVQKMVALHLRPIVLAQKQTTDSAIRRIIVDAGDDLESLFKLCRADITSKNSEKVKQYLANFDRVEQKIQEVESRDKLRNFQPLINGEIIMKTFNLKPSKMVGEIKTKIREGILEGIIKNNYEESFAYMLKIGKEMGLESS